MKLWVLKIIFVLNFLIIFLEFIIFGNVGRGEILSGTFNVTENKN